MSPNLVRWLVAGGAGLLLLGLLAYAEVFWLHDLPQDRVSRVVLVAFPAEGAAGASAPAAPAQDWAARLAEGARDPELLSLVEARLAAEGRTAALSRDQLRDRMAISTQCIRTTSPQGTPVQGVMLVNAVRGPSSAEVETIARIWSFAFIESGARRYPSVLVQPVEALGTTYELCR
jgi:hypothetical protein